MAGSNSGGGAARRILAVHEYTKHGIVPLEEVFEQQDNAPGALFNYTEKKDRGPRSHRAENGLHFPQRGHKLRQPAPGCAVPDGF